MKIERILLIQLFIFLSFAGNSQKVFDTAIVYPPFNELARQRPALDSIGFNVTKGEANTLFIYSKASSRPVYYNLGFEGDRYLLRKKWGAVALPEKVIALLAGRGCDGYYKLDGHWRRDSLFIRQTYWCNNDDSERVFFHIRHGVAFMGGKEKLRQQLEEAVTRYKARPDSTTMYIFQLLVVRDSSVSSVSVVEGDSSALARALMDELKRSGPWIPAQQGGRSVKSYLRVYVRIEPQRKLVVDYPED